MTSPTLILASASVIRAQLLQNAGLTIDIIPARIDEAELKQILTAQNTTVKGGDLAELLAISKALDISEKHPGALVIGADQTLQCGDTLYDKAQNLADARHKLLALRGNAHALYSSVVCARQGEIIWRYGDVAHLTMREFSMEFLGGYLARTGDDITTSVGGYKLEEEGSQLFSKITGDYFTILGLPLLPLLEFFRSEEILDK